MSIIIKGIDLPKDGHEPLKIEIWTNGGVFMDSKTDWICLEHSAIQIPTPHGRIIDADKIEAEAEQTLYGEVSYEDIANAPTILEAEE